MERIGKVEKYLEENQEFVVEALTKELHLAWVKEALRLTARESVRCRKLPAATTIWIVVLLCLFRRVSYANLLEKLMGLAWTRKHWGEEKPPGTKALTRARDRLGKEPLRQLFEQSSRVWIDDSPGRLLGGRRLYCLDGSTLKTSDSPENRQRWGKPGASRGSAAYPQMRVVMLADAGTRMIRAVRYGPYRRAEIDLARELLPEIDRDTIVVEDRNFLAYEWHWDVVHRRHADFIVRLKRNIKPRLIKRFSQGDELVDIEIPRALRRRRKDLPRTWRLRLITFLPEGAKLALRLLTSLTDPRQFPKEEVAQGYGDRWQEETIMDEMKTHLCACATVNRAVVFRSEAPERVEQELYALLLAYNVLRRIMSRAAADAQVCPHRISFVSTLERVREAIWDMGRLNVLLLPSRYRAMVKAIGRARVPLRPGRWNPRAVKIKMSSYPLKKGVAA